MPLHHRIVRRLVWSTCVVALTGGIAMLAEHFPAIQAPLLFVAHTVIMMI